MINITDKKNCCGCEACVQICPQKCITTQRDNEGFFYPKIIIKNCINCHLCEKVCPIINIKNEQKQINIYAAINKDEIIRKNSSSGGIFTLIAEKIIAEGGIVFGAAFDRDWNVHHTYTETLDGLSIFRGSKYVQSRIGDSYNQAEKFLKENRKVLFSGTPCQITGLKLFLRKEYSNLYTVDIKCHGVPSPIVWRYYLDEKRIGNKIIKSIDFRNKELGWYNYQIKITFNDCTEYKCLNTEDYFFKGFLQHIFIRPSCYLCSYKNGSTLSDITLADFWNIKKVYPELDDNKGVSCILIKNDKGRKLFEEIKNKLLYKETTYEACGGWLKDYYIPTQRDTFFKRLKNNNNNISLLIHNSTKKKKITLIYNKIKRIIHMLKNNTPIIIIDKPGQTCNRFWSYLDTIGYAIKSKKKIYIISWDPSIKYYKGLLEGKYTTFPMYSKLLIHMLGERKYLRISYRIANNRFSRIIYKVFNFELIYGWKQRASYKYFPSQKSKILEIFKPNQNICEEVEKIINSYKEKGYFIIGVHIRRGDYKYWENGKYYFELNEYALHMKNLLKVYNNKKIIFFISTNEKNLGNYFDDLEVFQIEGATVAHDLYALSLCNRIIGPLSTFSRWASFYGSIPLCFISRNNFIKSDSDFSIIKSFYQFENGEEIPNLTDKLII